MGKKKIILQIIVIGAGLCESYIARSLSHLSYRVVVVEKSARAGTDCQYR
jgi:L-2-hydroxyglutarate oxidase LhgO